MKVTYTWVTGTWLVETDDGHSEWLLNSNYEEDLSSVDDPVEFERLALEQRRNPGLLNECRDSEDFTEVSVDRDEAGKVVKFTFETS